MRVVAAEVGWGSVPCCGISRGQTRLPPISIRFEPDDGATHRIRTVQICEFASLIGLDVQAVTRKPLALARWAAPSSFPGSCREGIIR